MMACNGDGNGSNDEIAYDTKTMMTQNKCEFLLTFVFKEAAQESRAVVIGGGAPAAAAAVIGGGAVVTAGDDDDVVDVVDYDNFCSGLPG